MTKTLDFTLPGQLHVAALVSPAGREYRFMLFEKDNGSHAVARFYDPHRASEKKSISVYDDSHEHGLWFGTAMRNVWHNVNKNGWKLDFNEDLAKNKKCAPLINLLFTMSSATEEPEYEDLEAIGKEFLRKITKN